MGIEKASLVGNSFGGALAIAFMIAHPDRVDRAVLMGAAGVEFPITEALDYVWGYEPSMEMMRKTIAYLSTDPSRITESLIESRYEASKRPGAAEPYSATFGPKPRQNHLKMLCSNEEDVAAIPHEVLILHGKLDQVIPLEVSERLVKLIKNSDLHAFGNCGHWVQIERAASFNRLVTEFVKQGLNG
jgi:2-hydroxymuconate-semialdehyde hydrolase